VSFPAPATTTEPVRVMLCDDSAVQRGIMARILESDPGIRIVHRAGDGQAALSALAVTRPQVVLLDLEMPVMDGMTAIPLILKQAPGTAIIVASALTQRGAAAAMAALRAGAVDYVPKPQGSLGGAASPVFRDELIAKVQGWARMRRTPEKRIRPPPPAPVIARPISRPIGKPMLPPRLLAVGSSTGGPQALANFFKHLRPLPIPVAIVQHMPAGFTTMLADHLDKLGVMPCAEAKNGEVMQPGRIYLAPGDHHLTVDAGPGDTLIARLDTGPPVNYCRPAVDPMVQSASRICSGRVLAVILTGMGQDGLEGCRSLVAKGGAVFAQDEASSVVWGMPGAVSRAGIASLQSPPEVLAERVLEIFKLPGAKT